VNEATSALSKTVSLLESGILEGMHLGAQLYVSLGGLVVADVAVGHSRPGIPMRTDTLSLWLSAVKPITALAIAQLWNRKFLDLDDRVVKHIPGFGEGGKDGVTIRHLLTHTAGFRTADKCDIGHQWGEIIECICHAPLEPNWVPGEQAAYQISSSWYILGEIVRGLDGRPFEQYALEEILQPCGMEDSWLAVPPEQFRRYGDRIGPIYHTDRPIPTPHRRWNTETDAAVCRPGRNGRGPVRALGRLYEELLRLWQGETSQSRLPNLDTKMVRTLTGRRRGGLFDDTFRHTIDWGLGFCVNSNRYGRESVPYGYGRFCSEATFGHSGSQSSSAFADPAHGLVVAWSCNGMPGEHRHQRRARDLNSAIYQDLQLTEASVAAPL
jgi:CubicO group peptidase (beta-lactamase class C family)